jgi:AcrR family transcriptional regulator
MAMPRPRDPNRNSIPPSVLGTISGTVYPRTMAPASPPSTAPSNPPSQSLRDRTIRAVRSEITATAIRLFREQGYDETTVEQIAAAAGMSRTSFFRYFGSKEDVILGRIDELGTRVCEALAARPNDEPVWQSLRRAADALIADIDDAPDARRLVMRTLYASHSLKARELGRQLSWHDLMTPEVARRMGVADPSTDPRPRAITGAALACLNAAFDAWSASTDEHISLAKVVDLAMSAPNSTTL